MDKKTSKTTLDEDGRCTKMERHFHGYPQWISIHVHGHFFKVSMEYPWMSMDNHGYPWISMDIHGRCDVDQYGYPWISICIHIYPWISIFLHVAILPINQILLVLGRKIYLHYKHSQKLTSAPPPNRGRRGLNPKLKLESGQRTGTGQLPFSIM